MSDDVPAGREPGPARPADDATAPPTPESDTDPRDADDGLTEEERVAWTSVGDPQRARADSDADLWAFAFDSPLRAQEALLAAMRLVGRHQLQLEDAAIVTSVRGRVRITQTHDVSTGQGAVGGAWLGTLAGLFVGGPLIGMALGAAAGGLFAKLRDFGIDDAEMKRMGEDLAEGEAALFLLVEECHPMRALHEVSRFPGRLLASTADHDLVTQVRERLAVDPWDGV